jgi:hypothetical protein
VGAHRSSTPVRTRRMIPELILTFLLKIAANGLELAYAKSQVARHVALTGR